MAPWEQLNSALAPFESTTRDASGPPQLPAVRGFDEEGPDIPEAQAIRSARGPRIATRPTGPSPPPLLHAEVDDDHGHVAGHHVGLGVEVGRAVRVVPGAVRGVAPDRVP